MDNLYGTICLSDIPRSQMRRVVTRDGSEKVYLNIQVVARKEPKRFGDRVYTHFVSCSPRRDLRKEGENYIFGDLMRSEGRVVTVQTPPPSVEQVDASPVVDDMDNLPF